MNQWKEYKLKDLCNKIGSGATPSGGSNAYKTEGISLIRSQNVLDFKFSYDGLAFIDEEQADKLKGVKVYPNDILLNITGDSVARACIVPQSVLPARVNQHVAIIRTNELFTESEFVFYYLQFIKSYLLSISEIGGTRNAITKGMLEETNILLPPLPEQRAIASVLSSLDDKIDLLHRQNATLEALAETLFRQWFVEEAEESWEKGTLGDFVEINPKRTLKSGTLAPYLEMSNVSNQVYHPDNWYDREFSSGTKFINGDTLMARITPCLENGKSSYVDFLEDEQVGWGSTEYIVLRPKQPLHSFFSYVLTRNEDFRNYAISSLVGSSGRQRVDIESLTAYELAMPPSEVIERFNTFCENSLQKMKNNHTQIRTLTQLRDTILPKLMSGEVRAGI